MIAFLEGVLEEVEVDAILLNVHGVGYEIFVQNPQAFQFQQSYRLYTYTVYREDSQQLYGFPDLEQRNFFKLLVDKVNGVGPKLALAILRHFSMDELCSVIFNQDVDVLSKCPGIGKKTAQRLILELHDYLKKSPVKISSSVQRDTIEALTVLGYARKQAESIVDQIKEEISDTDTVETVLKKVFKLKKPGR